VVLQRVDCALALRQRRRGRRQRVRSRSQHENRRYESSSEWESDNAHNASLQQIDDFRVYNAASDSFSHCSR
jgi:hypothetical protein